MTGPHTMPKSLACPHLHALEAELRVAGITELFRGQAWSDNCREWVHVDAVLDVAALQRRFAFGPTVRVHENLDPRSGQERGLECTACHDAIVGRIDGEPVFR